MNNDKTHKSSARRRLLKSVVAGGGVLATGKLLPERWAEPVVQSVVLPAHAQTSPPVPTGDFGAAQSMSGANDRGRSILDYFVQPAHAGMSYEANVGNVMFNAFWSVRENEADICGEASFGNATVLLNDTVGRSGNTLGSFSQTVGETTLNVVNQQVSDAGVSLQAEANGEMAPLFAGPGPGCPIESFASLQRSSSPYPDDDEVV